jgi:hypothetical protein
MPILKFKRTTGEIKEAKLKRIEGNKARVACLLLHRIYTLTLRFLIQSLRANMLLAVAARTKFQSENLEGRNHLRDLEVMGG